MCHLSIHPAILNYFITGILFSSQAVCFRLPETVLQIRRGNNDIFPYKGCDPSLKPTRLDGSAAWRQVIFLLRHKKNSSELS